MVNTVKRSLSIVHWNIQGIKHENSEILKTDESDVIQTFNGNDIIILSEIHCNADCEITLEGYTTHISCREKHPRAKRYSGGIAVLTKRSIKEGIKIIPSKSPDLIWIKICKNYFRLEDDLFLGAIYISPQILHIQIDKKKQCMTYYMKILQDYR